MSSGRPTSPRVNTLARAHPLLHRAIQPRCHGSGAGTLSLFPAPPDAIARNGSFAPTRSARTPAVVKLAATPAGEASIAGHTRADVCPCRAHRADLLARGPPDTRLAARARFREPAWVERPAGPAWSSRGSRLVFPDELASPPEKETAFTISTGARAASRAAPRRETRSAAPEVPSIDVLPHSRPGSHPPSIRGWAAIHRMSPTCGVLLPAPLRSAHDPTGVDDAAGCEDSIYLLCTGP